ncbi:DUF2705 family protein [Ornithinibacillus contaminans]|uniref:DUF2705 family protein n=1 Tax=Ornithinibacillus contaminans TaxID=694055 RepID=UPI00064D85A1|nr:DUF2705 family protein [Ornithinibacillus contaminans]
MKKSKGIILFVFLLTFIQSLLYLNTLQYSFGFLHGVPFFNSNQFELKLLLYWFLPIVGLSFYFSGYIKDVLRTYGEMILLRNYSKVKWIIKRYFNMVIIVTIFTVSQISVSYIVSSLGGHYHFVGVIEFLKLIIAYYLFLVTIFTIQLFLELYVSPQVSQMMVSIYIVLSIILTKQLFSLKIPGIVYYILLPTLGMGLRNGVSSVLNDQPKIINFWTGVFILLIIKGIVIYFSVVRLKKMDIV